MAKFGVEATQLRAPDTSAAKFVRDPVVDTSKSIIPGMLGELAADAYKGYQLASLEKVQEKVIDDYLRPRQLEQDIGALEAATANIWKRIESDATYQPDVADLTGVEKALGDKLNKLRAAKEQGIMTPQEFSDRILATTREAVARNPGLSAELMQHSSRVLELSGITNIVKADIKAMEAQKNQVDEFNKRILTLAGQHNVPIYLLSSGLPDMARIKTEVEKIQVEKQLVEMAERFGKLDTEEKRQKGREFMESQGISLINGELNNLTSQFASLLNQGGDVTGALTQMRLMGESVYQKYFQKLSPILADSPAAKEALDYLRKQIDTTISFMEKASSKEDALARSNAITTMTRNANYQNLAKIVNPELLGVVNNILNSLGSARLLEANSPLVGKMINIFGDLLSGVSGSLHVDYTAQAKGKNVVSQGLVALAKEGTTDPNALAYFDKAINVIATDLKNPEKFKSTAEKFNFYSKLIKDLGDPNVKTSLSKVGAESVAQATIMIDDYMNLTTTDMWKQIRYWESKGVVIEGDVLPDGRFFFKTNNPEATKDLNSRYTPRINDSLMAMSNLMGLDTKSTAVNHFYQNYLYQFADDPDLVPLEIRTGDDARRALKAGKITQQEYQAIVKEVKPDTGAKPDTSKKPNSAPKPPASTTSKPPSSTPPKPNVENIRKADVNRARNEAAAELKQRRTNQQAQQKLRFNTKQEARDAFMKGDITIQEYEDAIRLLVKGKMNELK